MSDDLLFQEVDEDVRQEQYKKLWQRYGNYLMALCVAVVAAVAGFKGWEYWQVRQAEAAADIFLDAEKLVQTDKAEDALARFAAVNHRGYGQLARLREAAVLLGQDKTDEAVKIYDAVAADAAADAALRDFARVRAGYALAGSLKPAEIEARLAAVNVDTNVWRHAAREAIALSQYASADYAAADKTASALLADASVPPGIQQRMSMLSQVLAPLLPEK
mgnify:CR=1 FL=1